MRGLLRYFLINLVALYATSEVIKGVTYGGQLQTLVISALALTLINLLLVPLLRILLLPLNLLTLGLFSWVTNVIALFALTRVVPEFKLMPYFFPGASINGFIIPAADLTLLWVAIIASLMIGLITHILHWLVH